MLLITKPPHPAPCSGPPFRSRAPNLPLLFSADVGRIHGYHTQTALLRLKAPEPRLGVLAPRTLSTAGAPADNSDIHLAPKRITAECRGMSPQSQGLAGRTLGRVCPGMARRPGWMWASRVRVRGAHEPAQEHTPPAVRVPVSKARLAVQVLGARGHRNLEKLGQQERKVGDGAPEARSDTPPTGARHSQCSES